MSMIVFFLIIHLTGMLYFISRLRGVNCVLPRQVLGHALVELES